VTLDVTTDYPWDGKVTLKPRLTRPTAFELRLRAPGWCASPTLSVNGQTVVPPDLENATSSFSVSGKNGDAVELNLPMPVQRIAANPRVKANAGLLALQRGPMVYCLEACDQSEPLSALYLPAGPS